MNLNSKFVDFPKFKNVTVCNFTQMNCIWQKYDKMSGEVPMKFVGSTKLNNDTIKCNCLPDCEEVVSCV